jgi:cobaltochelatase CobS
MSESTTTPKADYKKHFSAMAAEIMSSAMAEAENESNRIINEAAARAKEIQKGQPTLVVQIADSPKAKLSSEAVPFLSRMIINAKLGLNTLLVGPAGCGKTTAAKQLAEALKKQFASVCLTAGASETWLFGRQTPTGFVEGPFSKLYKEGGVFLADEMDAADANLLLSINTALANGVLYNPMSGEQIPRHKDFVFVGAANTFGKGADHQYTGRSRLDAATLDRFVTIQVSYQENIEKSLCPEPNIFRFLRDVRNELAAKGLEEVVSTRAFDTVYKQIIAGVKASEVYESLVNGWTDDAVQIAKRRYNLLQDAVANLKRKQKEEEVKAQLAKEFPDGKAPTKAARKKKAALEAKLKSTQKGVGKATQPRRAESRTDTDGDGPRKVEAQLVEIDDLFS